MLLNEITGVKHLRGKTLSEIIDDVAKRLNLQIHGGRYGTVLTRSDLDYVVKIIENDPHYLEFVDYALANQNNPHVPKILKKPLQMHAFYTRAVDESNYLWIVRIEKLKPVKPTLLKFIVENLENAGIANFWLTDGYEYHAEEERTFNLPGGKRVKMSWVELFKHYPWLRTLGGTYIDVMKHVSGSPDIHGGNLMQRDNGSIVIIDPVWEGTNPYKDYDRARRVEMDLDGDPQMTSGTDYERKRELAKPRTLNAQMDDDIPF